MNCPACKDPMIAIELQKIEVDHCVACGGVWLDSGELELLLGDSESKNQLFETFRSSGLRENTKKSCPICSKKMEEVHYKKDEDILLDLCRLNHGIWFDKGELEKVIRLNDLNGNSEVLKLLQEIFAHSGKR